MALKKSQQEGSFYLVLTLHRPMYDLAERMDSAIFRKTGNTKGYYSQLLYGRTQHWDIRHKIHLPQDCTIGFLIEKDQIEKEGLPESHIIYNKIKSSDWYAKWTKRLNINKKNLKKILKTLLINNPSIIPRNHIVEKVLNDAIYENKKDSLNDFLNALNDPYKLRPFDDPYTKPPSPNEEVTQTFCGT